MTPARQLLTDYVLEHCVQEPLTLRLSLYRALAADLPANAPEFAQLTAMADELEGIEARHQQLVLDFKRRAEG
jgi:hypothetical protein